MDFDFAKETIFFLRSDCTKMIWNYLFETWLLLYHLTKFTNLKIGWISPFACQQFALTWRWGCMLSLRLLWLCKFYCQRCGTCLTYCIGGLLLWRILWP
jgi:hypothetical protein